MRNWIALPCCFWCCWFARLVISIWDAYNRNHRPHNPVVLVVVLPWQPYSSQIREVWKHHWSMILVHYSILEYNCKSNGLTVFWPSHFLRFIVVYINEVTVLHSSRKGELYSMTFLLKNFFGIWFSIACFPKYL